MNLHPAKTLALRRAAACATALLAALPLRAAAQFAMGEPALPDTVRGDVPDWGAGDDPACVPVASTTTPLKPTRADGSEISYCWGTHTWNEPADTGHPKLYQSFYFLSLIHI